MFRKKEGKFKRPYKWRHRIENVLSIVLFLIAMYLIVTPFVPQLWLLWAKATDKTQGFVYASNHPQAPKIDSSRSDVVLKPIPQENRLVIPTINVDILITEGSDLGALIKGGWRRPNTSKPNQGGNTVIAAHRFTYTATNASYFYNLDKVKVGDPIVIYWEGVEFNYTVDSIKEVEATAVEVENPTPDKRLTLYTCTPLLTAKKRLVVVAKPVEGN
jgi:sortase A